MLPVLNTPGVLKAQLQVEVSRAARPGDVACLERRGVCDRAQMIDEFLNRGPTQTLALMVAVDEQPNQPRTGSVAVDSGEVQHPNDRVAVVDSAQPGVRVIGSLGHCVAARRDGSPLPLAQLQ